MWQKYSSGVFEEEAATKYIESVTIDPKCQNNFTCKLYACQKSEGRIF